MLVNIVRISWYGTKNPLSRVEGFGRSFVYLHYKGLSLRKRVQPFDSLCSPPASNNITWPLCAES